MSERHPIAARTVVYEMPGMDDVTVRRDVAYAGALTMDIYAPEGSDREARLPAVVIVAGYPDPGVEKVVGCKFKEIGSSTSWARLLAASGVVAISYTNREPAADLEALLQYVHENGDALGIDDKRIGLWASSGNVPLALSVLMRDGGQSVMCAALCYGYMLDIDGSSGVAETARQFGFVTPAAGKSVDDLRRDVPLFIARAGRDEMPHLNDTLDRFVRNAVSSNLPLTFVNHPTGPHAFDLVDDSATSRDVIRQLLAFVRSNLLPR